MCTLLSGKTGHPHPRHLLFPETLTSSCGEKDVWELVKFWNEKEIWGKHVTSLGLQVIVFLKTRILFCFVFPLFWQPRLDPFLLPHSLEKQNGGCWGPELGYPSVKTYSNEKQNSNNKAFPEL